MKIVVAADSFKGSLTSTQAGAAIARGLRRGFGRACEIVVVPVADGGEGLVDAFVSRGAIAATAEVTGPLGEPTRATFALEGDRAVLELAAASGLDLVPRERRRPLDASTAGTGALVRAALDAGARRLLIGVGGSATTEGGAGCLAALGIRFSDASGRDLRSGDRPLGGAALGRLARVRIEDLDPRLRTTAIDLACDVDSVTYGPRGAAAVFGPQKGASPSEVAELDAALRRFARVTHETLGVDRSGEPGTGAGGAFAFGCVAYLDARIRPGFEVVAEATGLAAAVQDASLVVTGEGRIDAQTPLGKTVAGVARLAARARVPAIAFAGSIDETAREALAPLGLCAIEAVAPRELPLEDAMLRAAEFLEDAAARYARGGPFA